MILKAHFCWRIFNKASLWWEANVTQRVRKLAGGSLDRPPPTASPCSSSDLWGEKWTASYWWRVSTAAEVHKVPLTVQCTIHTATKLERTEPFDFLQSENCLHPIFLRCWAHVAQGSSTHCSWIQKNTKSGSVCVVGGSALCLPIRSKQRPWRTSG